MGNKTALNALNLMTTNDVAKKLGVTVRSVQLWVEQGLLEGWKTPGGHRRITSASFNRFLLSQQRKDEDQVDESRLRVVVVDDDQSLLMLYRLTIESWKLPISLKCVGNGVDGLISISKATPDVLITDLRMPEMDGFAMLEALTRSDIFSQMAVIVVTGLQTQEIEEHGGLPQGIRLYGKNPIPFWEMKEFMQRLIDSKLSVR